MTAIVTSGSPLYASAVQFNARREEDCGQTLALSLLNDGSPREAQRMFGSLRKNHVFRREKKERSERGRLIE